MSGDVQNLQLSNFHGNLTSDGLHEKWQASQKTMGSQENKQKSKQTPKHNQTKKTLPSSKENSGKLFNLGAWGGGREQGKAGQSGGVEGGRGGQRKRGRREGREGSSCLQHEARMRIALSPQKRPMKSAGCLKFSRPLVVSPDV